MGLYKRLKKFFQDKVGIGEARDRLDFLEKRIAYGQVLLQQLLPETLRFPPGIEAGRNQRLTDWGLAAVPTPIHKNDMMFRYTLLHHGGDLQTTLEEYDSMGREMAEKLSQWHGDSKDNSVILDFGGGHGRVSRFLPHYFPDSEIVVSEIKPDALEFQSKCFGFSTLLHGADAASFPRNRHFDCIFAGSVFTHLNLKDFRSWLNVLIGALKPGGRLIFTVHNLADSPFPVKRDFVFSSEKTEDFTMNEIEGRLDDRSVYGVSFVSEYFLAGLLKDQTYELHRHAFGGTQDVVVVRRGL